MTDIDKIVETALEPATFNLIDFTRGRALAEDHVELYTDENAALHLSDIMRGVDINAESFVPTDRMTELMEQVKASRVTLFLRGMDPTAEELLRNKAVKTAKATSKKFGVDSDEEAAVWAEFQATLLSHMLVKSVNAAGVEDIAKKTPEEITVFRTYLPATQRELLDIAINKVMFASRVISDAVDPGFLAKF